MVGCRQPASAGPYCSQHASMASGSSSPMSAAPQATISIYWEGATSSIPVAKIPVDPQMTLSQIDAQFKRFAPQSDSYSYIYRTDVIMESFWEQFTASKLGQTLYIRKKFGSGLSADLLAKAQVVQPTQKGNKNPFKMSDNDRLQANLGAEKPTFHRPAMVAPIKLTVPKSTNIPTIPVEKSSSAPVGPSSAGPPGPTVMKPGQTVDDLLKSRTKLFIKQK